VEVGLQSIERDAMELMDRKNNLKAFEKGVRALMAAGINVTVDLIVGLPGDTEESVRRGLRYLRDGGLYSRAQVFNLAVLPGTAFRHEAAELDLAFQPRPPYYVLRSPTLDRAALFGLMQEAQEVFEVEFDASPSPVLDFSEADGNRIWRVDLDASPTPLPSAANRAQAFTLWLRSANLLRHRAVIAGLIRELLAVNPFTTLQVVLEPTGRMDDRTVNDAIDPTFLNSLLAACLENPTYLDKFYALLPGRPNGAKRLVVLLPLELRPSSDADRVAEAGSFASVVWRSSAQAEPDDLEPHEYVWCADIPTNEQIEVRS
jgi:hypothetical protein